MLDFSPITLFYLLAIPVFAPLLIYKSFYLKMVILAYAYPVWLMGAYAFGIPVTRIMSNIGTKNYSNYYSEAFILAFLSYFAFLIALWSIRNKEYSFSRLKLNQFSRLFLFFFLFIILFIAYPAAFGLSDHRFGSLGGVVVFFISILVLTSKKNTKHDYISKFLFLLLLFLILRGERVDFILSLVLISLFLINISKISIFKFGLISLAILLLAVISGLMRAGSNIDYLLVFESIPLIVTNFGTAVDVIHVYLSSVAYYHEKGVDFYPILNIVYSYIPLFGDRGVSSSMNFTNILKVYIFNMGGGLFYSVGMMAFGGVGVVLIGYLYGYIYKKLFLIEGVFSILFLSFFILQFRLQWYGLTYFSTSFLLGIIFYLIFKRYKKKTLKKSMTKSITVSSK